MNLHTSRPVAENEWQALQEGILDLLVVGGGVVGAGTARDAALRGMRVGLVEQSDFASGTSSRTSRLLHGGIRYLAQGHVLLVREASREKGILSRIAPHLVAPLPFVFPVYRDSPWPLWQLRIGVKIYDLLAGRNFEPSRSFDRAATLRHLPGLRAEQLRGAVRYFDALTCDARLVIDTLRSAAAAGAVVRNYVAMEHAEPCAEGWKCRLRDRISEDEIEIRSRSVVAAEGPWAGRRKFSSMRLRLTKGVHLVIDRGRLPLEEAVVMTDGPRIMFAIPWGRRVILGTTDTDYEGDPAEARTEPADVDAILAVVNRSVPDAAIEPADVKSTWAGIRPLIASTRGGPSDISRSHRIDEPLPGWFDVAGGKLTTYRLMAEQVVDRVVRRIGRSRQPCRTADLPFSDDPSFRDSSGIVAPEPSEALVAEFCRNQWAVFLDDVMLRRTSWHHDRDDAEQVAGQVADWMAPILGWDESARAAQLERYRLAAG